MAKLSAYGRREIARLEKHQIMEIGQWADGEPSQYRRVITVALMDDGKVLQKIKSLCLDFMYRSNGKLRWVDHGWKVIYSNDSGILNRQEFISYYQQKNYSVVD